MNIRKAFALALAIVASARASASEPSLETVTPRQVFTDEAAALTLTGDGLEEGASVALLDGGPFVAGSLQPVPLDAGPVVRLDARYVAVASYLEIDVIDVSDPRHPVLAASVPGPRSPIAMATEAGVLAVSSYYPTGEVQLYDVSRPTEPTFVAAVATPLVPERLVLADGVLFVGSWWGYCGFFSVGALTAFSVADPAAPVRLGELPLTGCTHDLAIQQGVAWLLTQEAGEPGMRLTAVDVTDPRAPVELSRREWTNYDPEDWIGLAVEGSTGFVVQEYPHTLRSLDLSDPSSPRVLYDAETWLGGYFRNAVADRGRLFLDLDGIRLFDVRRPEAPRGFTKVGPFGIRGFAVHGDHVYASADSNAGGFLVLDVSVPLRPAAFRPLEGLPGTPLASSGPIVYAVDDSSRVRIQDWSDPDSPHEIAVISDAGSVGALAVDGARLFVSDVSSSGNRIVAYDVGDPSHPVRLGSIGGIYSYHVASAGGFVYALDLISRAMLAIDARDPAAMHVTSSLPLGRLYDWRLALSADGSRAYVMQVPSFQGPIFLLTFDLADPGSPRNDGVTGWFGAGGRLVVDGTDVWIADREAGVLRIDAADPTRMIVSVVIPDLHALGLARVGPLLAVTSGGQTPALDELRVYDISRPEGLRLVQQHPMEKASFGAFPIGDTLIVDETTVRLQPVLPDLRRSGERTGATSLLPGHPPGPYDVQVVNPDGGLSRLHNALLVCERRQLRAALSPGAQRRWTLSADADPAAEERDAAVLLPELGDPIATFATSAGPDTIRISIPTAGRASVVLAGTDESRLRAAWDAARTRGGILLRPLGPTEYGDVGLSARPLASRREPRRYTYVLNGGFLSEANATGPGVDLTFELRARDGIGCLNAARASYVETLVAFCADSPGSVACTSR